MPVPLPSVSSATRRDAVVLAHAAATLVMVGILWMVQVVHYPLFREVGDAAYPTYQSAHISQIGPLLLLPWGIEALTVLVLVLVPDPRLGRHLPLVGAWLFAAIVVVTVVWAAPIHGLLADAGGFDAALHGDLLRWNMVRTVLWTARGAVAVALVWRVMATVHKT